MYGLKNIVEEMVMKKIDELQPNVNCCTCEKCRLDVASYALNHLPAKYVVTHKGELMGKLFMYNPQMDMDITSAVIRAFQLIGEHPQHDEDPIEGQKEAGQSQSTG